MVIDALRGLCDTSLRSLEGPEDQALQSPIVYVTNYTHNTMLAILGASGKLGFATLSSLLSEDLLHPSSIVCTTSATDPSDSRWQKLAAKDVHVRHASFDDAPEIIQAALKGCTKLFLVSSPRVPRDFNDAPPGTGREHDHIVAIDAAIAAGIKHIYYTSLAFADNSRSGVMVAHLRTEAYLKQLAATDLGFKYTIIREGLYNESWPLYFGHYEFREGDSREEVLVGGDSPISWTSIPDLGLANALVLAAPEDKYAGKTLYLSNTREPRSLADIASLVSKARGKEVRVRVVSREEHERFYIQERKMSKELVQWWAKTYDALRDSECKIEDTTLEDLLKARGKEPKRIEETVREMLGK